MRFNKRIYKNFLGFLVFTIFFTAVFCLFFDMGSVSPPGISMLPLFSSDDSYLTLRWWTRINRYDVVLVHEPGRDDRLLIKRVVGIPGETLELKQGKIFVNGKLLFEPYIKNPKQRGVENYIMRNGSARITIPAESYFFDGRQSRQLIRFKIFRTTARTTH